MKNFMPRLIVVLIGYLGLTMPLDTARLKTDSAAAVAYAAAAKELAPAPTPPKTPGVPAGTPSADDLKLGRLLDQHSLTWISGQAERGSSGSMPTHALGVPLAMNMPAKPSAPTCPQGGCKATQAKATCACGEGCACGKNNTGSGASLSSSGRRGFFARLRDRFAGRRSARRGGCSHCG